MTTPTRLFLVAALLAVAGCGGGTHGENPPHDGSATPDGGSDGGPLSLAPGEVAELPVAAGATGVRLATPTGEEKFLVVLASTVYFGSDEWDYSIALGAAPAATAPPPTLRGCALDDAAWRDRMLPMETPPSGTAPAMGATRKLLVSTGAGTETIDAQVIALGERTVVWADTTAAHPASIEPAVVADFLKDFDTLILPRERTLFGMESDLDGDGRISLVFSPLTYRTAVAFFTGCDLQKLPGCPNGNHGEFLYLTPPNAIKPPYNTAAAIKETLAHELGHLIHFNRKVLRNKLMGWDDSAYMIEGFGALAQDTTGFQAGNLYVTKAGLEQVDDFSLADALADGTRYDTSRDGGLRGGSYLFVRWLYDRGGGDLAKADGSIESRGGPAFVRALLDAMDPVAEAIPPVGQTKIEDVGMDFYTALAMSNREDVGDAAAANPCFRYLPVAADPVTTRPRGANLFASFHGMSMSGPAIQPADSADGTLRTGGVEFIAIDAAAGQPEVAFTMQVAADASPRVRIGRIR